MWLGSEGKRYLSHAQGPDPQPPAPAPARTDARARARAPQVHFHVQGRGLDGTIRRAAHIMLLESVPFLRHLAVVARPYFE